MPVKRGSEEGTDDTEGNAAHGRFVDDGAEDDTEGNSLRAHGVADGVEDDTEGNGACVRH